jgi:hypothetical protein
MSKSKGVIALAVSIVMVLAWIIPMWLSRPERIGLNPKTLHISVITSPNGEGIAMVEGPRSNYLGVVQSVGYTVNPDRQIIYLEKYAVRWHPFSEVETVSDWPLVIDTSILKPGTYDVRCWTKAKGFVSAGTFNVSPAGGKGGQ